MGALSLGFFQLNALHFDALLILLPLHFIGKLFGGVNRGRDQHIHDIPEILKSYFNILPVRSFFDVIVINMCHEPQDLWSKVNNDL